MSNGLQKVKWRNGDVISEQHFYTLEKWVEELVSLGNQSSRSFGLFRHPYLQPDYNDLDNIKFRRLKGTDYQVEISKFQAYNVYGNLIKIDSTRSFDFQLRPSSKNLDGTYSLFIMSSESDSKLNIESDSEPVTGVTVYDALYNVSISNDKNTGVLICHFKVIDNELMVDKSYIPFGLFINSSPLSLEAHKNLLKKFNRWSSLLENYLKSLKPTPELVLIWTSTCQFIRVNSFSKSVFENSHLHTLVFFDSIQQYFNLIKSELQILSVGWEQISLIQRINEVVEKLNGSVTPSNELQINLTESFKQSEELFDSIIKVLSYFPSGPIAEKTLPISKVELIKEAAGNRFNIYLENEAQFLKGKTQISFQLREFSKSEPIGKNIRVGIGIEIFAQLLDLKNMLKRVQGEAFNYAIECPPQIVNKEKASQLTLYLPQPLGEGVTDLKSHITIIIRD